MNKLSFVMLCLALPLVAGCIRTSPIPVADGSTGYEQIAFKDVAPANATVADFPRTFKDVNGQQVQLSQFLGRKVVLVVLRGMAHSEKGGMCPSCLAQAGGLMHHRQEFEKRGVEVMVLFPGASDRVGEFIETARRQTPGEPKQSFRLLLDQDLAVCDRLSIRDDLAKPSTYILDSAGNVTYAYVGETSTDRPSLKAILNQLDLAQ